MRHLFLLAVVCAGVMRGQGGSPAPSPSSGNQSGNQSGTFFAFGASMLPSTRPAPTGWSALATPTTMGGSIWSISGIDYTITPSHQLQTLAWTSMAIQSKASNGIDFFILGGGGSASTGSNSGYSITTGVMAVIPIKYGDMVVGWTVEKSSIGGTQTFVKVGWGNSMKGKL